MKTVQGLCGHGQTPTAWITAPPPISSPPSPSHQLRSLLGSTPFLAQQLRGHPLTCPGRPAPLQPRVPCCAPRPALLRPVASWLVVQASPSALSVWPTQHTGSLPFTRPGPHSSAQASALLVTTPGRKEGTGRWPGCVIKGWNCGKRGWASTPTRDGGSTVCLWARTSPSLRILSRTQGHRPSC